MTMEKMERIHPSKTTPVGHDERNINNIKKRWTFNVERYNAGEQHHIQFNIVCIGKEGLTDQIHFKFYGESLVRY